MTLSPRKVRHLPTDVTSSRTHRLSLAAAAGILLLVFAIYFPVAHHEFLDFDDDVIVTANPHLKGGISWAAVQWAFSSFYEANWIPLTMLSHLASVQLFGSDAGPHHLVNVGLHALNVVLLLRVLTGLTGAPWRSAVVAALFAVHPLNVEAVAWVSARKDLLSTCFWLLAVRSYHAYTRAPGLRRYAAVIVWFLAGALAKPIVMVLPVALLLLDVWPLGRLGFAAGGDRFSVGFVRAKGQRTILLEKAPLLVLSALVGVVTVAAQARGGAVGSFSTYPVGTRAANAIVSYVTYLAQMVWPHNLAAYYPHRGAAIPAWEVTVCAAIVIALSAAALALRERMPYLLVGWLSFVCCLLPVIGLIQVGGQAWADRYAYLSLLGIFIALVWGIADVGARAGFGKAVAGAAVLAVLGFSVTAAKEVSYWRTTETLFTRALLVTKDNCVAYNNIGSAQLNRGELGAARANFEESLRIRPGYPLGHSNLGNVLARMGEYQSAIEHLSYALEKQPNQRSVKILLGMSFAALGRFADAERYYREVLSQDPSSVDAHVNLGNLLLDTGKLDEATDHYREALTTDPGHALAHFNLAVVYERKNMREQAVREYQAAVRIKPDLARLQRPRGR